MSFNQIINRLNKGFSVYNEFLNNKKFIVFFEANNTFNYKEIYFQEIHFKHLTGVKSPLSASKFYQETSNKRLTNSDIIETEKGSIKLKLSILHQIHLPLYSPSMIGEYNGYVKFNLKADEVLGTTKSIVLGLVEKTENTYIPNSLLKENIKQISHPTYPVVLVLKKNVTDLNYTEVSYCKNGLCPQTFFNNNKAFFGNLKIDLLITDIIK